MTDDSYPIEDRVKMLESVVQSLTARIVAEGQITEFLLSTMFIEKGESAEAIIKQHIRNQSASSPVKLSDSAAVWWSDSAVLIEPMRNALLERVERLAADLRRAERSESS